MNLEYLARSRSMSDFVDFTFEIKESGGVVVKDMPSQIRSRMWKPHTREQQPFHANNLPTAGIMRGIQMNSEQIQIRTLSCCFPGKH